MSDCEHDRMEATTTIVRMTEKGKNVGFMAEVRIHCSQCLMPFEFMGISPGLDLKGPACSVDKTEGRFAIKPHGASKS